MTDRQPSTWINDSAALALQSLLMLLVVAPLAVWLTGPLRVTADPLGTLRDLLSDAVLLDPLRQTLVVALLACALASAAAIPLAGLASRASATARGLLLLCAGLAFAVPPYLTAAALRHLDQTLMAATGWSALLPEHATLALIGVYALHGFPLILLSLSLALVARHRSAAESARSLGAGRFARWRWSTLPDIGPAYGLGATLTLLKISEDAATPLMLGIDGLLAPHLVTVLRDPAGAEPGLAVGSLALLALSALWLGLGGSSLPPPDDRHWSPRREPRPLGRASALASSLTGLATVVVGLVALLPVAWLLAISLTPDRNVALVLPAIGGFEAYRGLLSNFAVDTGPTLRWAVASGLATAVLGGVSALAIVSRGRLSRLSRLALLSLFAVPGVVLALAARHILVFVSGEPVSCWACLSLIVVVEQLPIAAVLIAYRIGQLQDGRLDAARSLGASAPRALLGIALPALAVPLAAAFLIGGIALLAEASVAMVLIDDPMRSLPLTAFGQLQTTASSDSGAARGILLIALIAPGLLIAYRLLRPRHRTAPRCRRVRTRNRENRDDEQRTVQP